MSCCKLDPTYLCHMCQNKKCIECVHILIERPLHQETQGCYCYTCMQKHSTLWVSCLNCNEKVRLISKPKHTLLDIHLKCDDCELRPYQKNGSRLVSNQRPSGL